MSAPLPHPQATRPFNTYDITTFDGVVHRGFRAYSSAEAAHDFLLRHPLYGEDDIVAGGIVLRPVATSFGHKAVAA